ncbi:MAG: 16S rRNA (cytosine(967)-C(5))-methyltransferase RsmB [Actinobacteria bacterium]|nr:16S rRNA (cytosine(967)-C(5))-methyltransferase RsmB [Actinomycetota bacterium]
MRNHKSHNPRYIAFCVLNNYFFKNSSLKDEINRYFSRRTIPDIDRRFAYELIQGTVRFYLKLDYIISHFSRRPIDKIDFKVLNILRSAVYQFLYMDRVPGHAIVNESVSIAKKYTGISSGSYVNAMLRRISKVNGLSIFTASDISENIKDMLKRISINYSFPLWLVKYFCRMYSLERVLKTIEFFNRPPQVFIRVNRLKITKKQLLDMFYRKGFTEGKDFLSMGDTPEEKKIFSDTFILKKIYGIKELDIFKAGYFYMQDFSSQFAVKYFLKPLKKQKILDLCGAPGGKATYISELTNDECVIDSVDINPERLLIFKENIDRLGIKNINIIEGDAANLNLNNREDYYDSIFIDCPCSAFGTISKNPDVKYNKNTDDLKRLATVSEQILSGSLKYLKPGGKIVFYTCTLSYIENQQIIKRFLKSNQQKCRPLQALKTDDINVFLERKQIQLLESENYYFEIFPHYFGSEGGFISVIEKIY